MEGFVVKWIYAHTYFPTCSITIYRSMPHYYWYLSHLISQKVQVSADYGVHPPRNKAKLTMASRLPLTRKSAGRAVLQ